MKKVSLTDPQTGDTREVSVVEGGVRTERDEPIDRGRPDWLKAALPSGGSYARLKGLVQELELHTVCQEARCPNVGECWVHGTATIMILGRVCTRACKFCAVSTGNPAGWLDPREPAHVARAVAELGLGYVVLTSVDRDDLPDGGAGQFAAVIRAIKERAPAVRVEALTPDFQGSEKDVGSVMDSGLDVFAHNLETVRRLTPGVRDPRADYDQSLAVLDYAGRYARQRGLEVLTKSSLMVGLGERDEEVYQAMDDLLAAGVSILTIGQYLRPTRHHLPVRRYVTPAQFETYRRIGLEKGFLEVFSGPLVRSSYRAERVFEEAREE